MGKQEHEIMTLKNQLASKEFRDNLLSNNPEFENKSPLQVKLRRMHDCLEKAKQLNMSYQSDHAFQISNEEERDEIRRQAEAETVEDLQKKMLTTIDDNRSLKEELGQKDIELTSLAEEWELLTSEIEEVLLDGCEAIVDASEELGNIRNSFPQKRIRISEQVGMIVRKISENELLIDELRRCLEDARNKRSDMECMLKSLRSAAGNDTKDLKSRKVGKNVLERDATIRLLRKEIECALESLKEVQYEMARLHEEKKEMSVSEKKSRQSIECLTNHILFLQEAMYHFEEKSKVKIDVLSHKLRGLEKPLKEANSHWYQRKESLELEVGEAKIIQAQKAQEASFILAKFEEAQDTMRETDIMINGLVIANESMKIDIERLKDREMTLLNEKGTLVSNIESLQTTETVNEKESSGH
ncbi:hypothetical protein JHK87_044687 [Glycine soja]|nr:hypothetical protein JHK87_044687 [Glycine soja]